MVYLLPSIAGPLLSTMRCLALLNFVPCCIDDNNAPRPAASFLFNVGLVMLAEGGGGGPGGGGGGGGIVVFYTGPPWIVKPVP